MHADIAWFCEQELRAIATPRGVCSDIFAGHQVAEPVAYERDIQLNGEKLDYTYRERKPICDEDDANHLPPVKMLDGNRDSK